MLLLAQDSQALNPAAYVIIGGMMLVVCLYLVFWIWQLVDCIRHEPQGSMHKYAWVIAMIVFGGVAAFFYNVSRRKQRIKLYGN